MLSEDEVRYHDKHAQALRGKFMRGCDVLEYLLTRYDGVLPVAVQGDDALRRRQIEQHDVSVFSATSTMIGALRDLHRNMGEINHLPRTNNPYSFACEAMRYRLQGVLFAHPKVQISFGKFHENVHLLAGIFVTPLDVSGVAPSQEMLRQRERLAAAAAKLAASKPKKPAAGRSGGTSQSAAQLKEALELT